MKRTSQSVRKTTLLGYGPHVPRVRYQHESLVKYRNTSTATLNSLASRHCLVTGGASGIGFEISKQLLLNGASSVRIVTRSTAKGEKAIEVIKQELKVADAPISLATCDFSSHDPNSVFDHIKQGLRRTGGAPVFNTLINCAGLSQTSSLLTTSPSSIAGIIRVNLEVPIHLSRAFLKDYLAYGRSLAKQSEAKATTSPSFCVVNISSLLADRGGYGCSVYSSSKAGLIALTRTLALEGAAVRDKHAALPVFRANSVLPGYIDTPMTGGFSETHSETLRRSIPLRRFGSSAEVGDAVMFLLKNEYANNTTLNLDGGLSTG